MQFGEYEVTTIETGEFRLDGGAMFGVVPKVLWERTNPPDEKNRIAMALRSLLIRGKGKVILVDTGIGHKWSDSARDRYGIDHSRHELMKELEKCAVKPEEVTDVILTHLHFDHVGGSTGLGKDGKPGLAFPHATYYIQEENLTHAHAPTERDRASFLQETILPLQQSGKLRAVQGNFAFAPGISAWVTHGHTPGHQLVKLTSGGKTVLFCGDTIPTSSHIPIPYIAAFDLEPLKVIEEKKMILDAAVKENWVLVFAHDPTVAACTVTQAEGKVVRGAVVIF